MDDAATEGAAERYLDLMEVVILGLHRPKAHLVVEEPKGPLRRAMFKALRRRGLSLIREIDQESIEAGQTWSLEVDSMIGRQRMHHLRAVVEKVLRDDVPGDLIEAGVWRGGASLLMKATLAVHGDRERTLWLADSFQGLPPASGRWQSAAGAKLHAVEALAVPVEEVEERFRRYELLDERVQFVEGWFSETLPALADKQWSVVRLDGDLYDSTAEALESLYPGLAPGGFLIVDDYHALEACRAAVDDYRRHNEIAEPIEPIDEFGVYWRRGSR